MPIYLDQRQTRNTWGLSPPQPEQTVGYVWALLYGSGLNTGKPKDFAMSSPL